MKKKIAVLVVLALAAITLGLFLILGGNDDAKDEGKEVSVNKAISLIEDGKIKSAKVTDATILTGSGSMVMTGENGKEYNTTYTSGLSNKVNQTLLEENVKVEAEKRESNPIAGLIGFLPFLLILSLVVFLLWKQGMFKRSKFDAGLEGGRIPDVQFKDVAGADEAVHEIRELIEFMQGGERFIEMGATPPNGALLVGPAGTGKTLLAKAAAGESKLPFYSLAGSDFLEVFAGLGARRVRKLFERARKTGGIIFIDEIDAVGQKRGSTGNGGDAQERENIIAAFLTEMDGFEPRDNVLVLAATNRPETIDPALMRPGRLERQIHVPLPDLKGREGILEVHAQGKNISADVELKEVAKRTVGMSGAELAFVINEACMSAVRREHRMVTSTDIYDAVNTVAMGRSRDSAYMNDTDKELTAYHEAGHAVVAILASRGAQVSVRPNFVTIVPRGAAGGLTRMHNEETHYLRKSTGRDMLAVSMGGRAAEIAVYGEEHYTSGASGDLQSATNMATTMMLKYGMSDDGRLIAMDDQAIQMSQGKHDHLVQKEIADALERAKQLLATEDGQKLLEAIARGLLESESLHEEDIDRIEREALNVVELERTAVTV